MPKLYFQSIVQYWVDTATGQTEITKRYVIPIKGAQTYKAALKKDNVAKAKKTISTIKGGEVTL